MMDSITLAEIHQWYEDNHDTKNMSIAEVRSTTYQTLARMLTPAELAAARMTSEQLEFWKQNHTCQMLAGSAR